MRLGRSVLYWVWVFALVAVSLVGCQEVVVTVPLVVTTLEPQDFNGGGPPIEGVKVCETDTDNCAVTDGNGEATIHMPANEEVSYTLEKEGYWPYLVRDVTDETFRDSNWPMYSDELMADFAEALMIRPPLTGLLSLQALSAGSRGANGTAGITFDLMNETAVGFYNEEDWTPTLDLTATTSAGLGGFVEVPPGEYQVEFGGTCIPDLAWPGDAANRIEVPVRAGYFNYSTMTCDAL